MGKYRYARSNGEFLPSRFVERVQSVNPDFFATEEAYNLTKAFVSGTQGDINSFVSKRKLSGYTGKHLSAWWRLDKDVSASGNVTDSSGNGRSGTFDAVGDRPAYSTALYPSAHIQKSSYTFDGSDDGINVGTAATWDAIIGNDTAGGSTQKMTLAAWVYKTGSGGGTHGRIFEFGKVADGSIHAYTTDSETLAFYTYWNGYPALWYVTSAISLNTWAHIVITYDASSTANSAVIYVDGVSQTVVETGATRNVPWSGIATDACYIGNKTDGTRAFQGSLADVAVWNRILTATEVLHLYSISSNGAFREVRNFDQVSPENDTRVLGVKSSTRGFNVSGFPADMMDGFRQGINVVTFKQLVDYTSFKIRPNSSFITTIKGKDVSRKAFDDSIAMTTFPSGTLSGGAHVSLGGVGRLSKRLSHERELRDLGQSDVYVNLDGYEAYEDTLDLDPISIITKDPLKLVLPRQLVVQTSDEMADGAIEPLIIRSKIDNTSIEAPFFAHDFRADLGGMIDPFRRSMILTYGWDLDEPTKGAAPFLDSVEQFGTSGSVAPFWTSGSIDLPGAFSDNFAVIEPYVDYLNDRDKEYTTNSVSTTISNILIVSGTFTDDDMRTHDKMAHAGFIFDNNPIGIDSIAYGGLKK